MLKAFTSDHLWRPAWAGEHAHCCLVERRQHNMRVAQVAALAELLQAHGVEGVDEVMAQARLLACACVPYKCAASYEQVHGIQQVRKICSVHICRGNSVLQQRAACVQVEADYGFGDAEDEGDEDAEDPSASPAGESCSWFGNCSAFCPWISYLRHERACGHSSIRESLPQDRGSHLMR